jgi:hypothetical protein
MLGLRLARGNGAWCNEMLPNNSLDASGTSGFVSDNLSVAWLSSAASTQTLGCFPYVIFVEMP